MHRERFAFTFRESYESRAPADAHGIYTTQRELSPKILGTLRQLDVIIDTSNLHT